MQIDESFENWFEDAGNLMLIKFLLGNIDKIDDTSSDAELENNPKIVIFEIGAIVFDNMLIIT